MSPRAWATNDPTVVAEYLAAREVISEYARRINAAAVGFGGCLGAAQARSSEGSALIGLMPADESAPPPGWKFSRRARCFTPATGSTGRAAREWMKANQPPRDPYSVLTGHGLPPNDLTGEAKDGHIAIASATVGVHDGTVWALYQGEPGDWLSGPRAPGELWTERPVSDFWRAAEEKAARAAGEQLASVR
jgi:hypothetical protein